MTPEEKTQKKLAFKTATDKSLEVFYNLFVNAFIFLFLIPIPPFAILTEHRIISPFSKIWLIFSALFFVIYMRVFLWCKKNKGTLRNYALNNLLFGAGFLFFWSFSIYAMVSTKFWIEKNNPWFFFGLLVIIAASYQFYRYEIWRWPKAWPKMLEMNTILIVGNEAIYLPFMNNGWKHWGYIEKSEIKDKTDKWLATRYGWAYGIIYALLMSIGRAIEGKDAQLSLMYMMGFVLMIFTVSFFAKFLVIYRWTKEWEREHGAPIYLCGYEPFDMFTDKWMERLTKECKT
jgi:hypothetical protein